MTAPVSSYVAEAVARCQLRVKVQYPAIDLGWRIVRKSPFLSTWHDTPAEATAAYISLVRSLQSGERA